MLTDRTLVPSALEFLSTRYNPRAVDVMVMRFFHDMFLKDIGKEIGVSTERVRMIEAKSLRILKKFMSLNRITPTEVLQ